MVDYRVYKPNLYCEQYLHEADSFKGRVALTCCRAGVSGLRVDTGRWEYVYVAAGKKIRLPRISRTCLLCGRGVEDVKHVLCACPEYANANVCACPVYANERKTLHKASVDDENDTSDLSMEGQITHVVLV